MSSLKNKKLLFKDFPPVETKRWVSDIEKDLDGKDFETELVWKTYEKIDLQPFYREEDIKNLKYLNNSAAGELPYLRGNKTQNNIWLINEEIDEKRVLKANREALHSIKNGADSITFNVDIFKNQNDVEMLLKNIDFEKVNINFAASSNLKDLLSILKKASEISNNRLKGFLFFDPIKDGALKGSLKNSIESSFVNIKELMIFSRKKLPGYRIVSVQSYPFELSGANIAQELAFTLNTAVEYIEGLLSLGLDIDSISRKMVFSFSVGSNYFMEIAKMRAARLLWAKIIEQYDAKEKESYQMYIHAHTAHFNKTIYDPYINIIRGSTETMAAAIGGADSITVNPFDFYYKKPEQFSNRTARNSQLILREEAYLGKVIDPGGGSYYIEKLTESISNEVLNLFKKIEKSGGFIEALKNGEVQQNIKNNREEVEKNIFKRKEVFLGTNKYPDLEEKILSKISKQKRSNSKNKNYENSVEFEPLLLARGSTQFERIRLKTEKHAASTGKTPKVFLLQLGNLKMRKARANFSLNFFGCGGFEVIDNSGFDSVDEGVKAAIKSNPDVVVICSSDNEYTKIVPETIKKIKTISDGIKIIVAGSSKVLSENLKNVGVDDFINSKSNTFEVLSKYQNLLGINVN
ncbi:MAG: methylmalonyl-CoA mutase family protein [Thermodesulfobacteriota bacterium]